MFTFQKSPLFTKSIRDNNNPKVRNIDIEKLLNKV